jgi:hypothetical protein
MEVTGVVVALVAVVAAVVAAAVIMTLLAGMKMGLAAVAVKEEYLAEMVLRVLALVVVAAKGAAVLV